MNNIALIKSTRNTDKKRGRGGRRVQKSSKSSRRGKDYHCDCCLSTCKRSTRKIKGKKKKRTDVAFLRKFMAVVKDISFSH